MVLAVLEPALPNTRSDVVQIDIDHIDNTKIRVLEAVHVDFERSHLRCVINNYPNYFSSLNAVLIDPILVIPACFRI